MKMKKNFSFIKFLVIEGFDFSKNMSNGGGGEDEEENEDDGINRCYYEIRISGWRGEMGI